MLYSTKLVIAMILPVAWISVADSQTSNTRQGPANDHSSHGAFSPYLGGHMAGVPKASVTDVASPETIVEAYYESLSGPKGKKRDWNRFLSLFFMGAKLLPAEGKGHSGTMPRSFTPQTFLFNTEPNMMETGYIPKEIARRTVGFGKIVHVFSTYEVRHASSDTAPFIRGINSFQLLFDGKRWRIFDVMWQPETPTLTLPSEYLQP